MLDALLSPGASRLYERILEGESIRVASGADTDLEVDGTSANELASLGLVKRLPVDPNVLLAVEPGLALTAVVQPLWQRAGEAATSVGDVIRELEVLQQRYVRAEGAAWDESRSVILRDPRQISIRHAAMTRSADREILALASRPTLTSNPPTLLVPEKEQRVRGLVARTVFESSFLDGLEEHVLGSVRGGEQVRIIAGLPIKMKVVDRREAIVGLDETALRAALYVREPAFIDALCILFESVWERAVPYAAGTEDAGVLTSRERQVLVLLATGDKDEAIAKKLGVGVRTVRRHISNAMQKLGTESRFAAGVQVVKRGWL